MRARREGKNTDRFLEGKRKGHYLLSLSQIRKNVAQERKKGKAVTKLSVRTIPSEKKGRAAITRPVAMRWEKLARSYQENFEKKISSGRSGENMNTTAGGPPPTTLYKRQARINRSQAELGRKGGWAAAKRTCCLPPGAAPPLVRKSSGRKGGANRKGPANTSITRERESRSKK